MPRISRRNRNEVSASAGAIYDRYLRDRGNVPNMFRTMAHRPEIFETIIAHMEAVLNTGTLPKALKELVIVRTSQINRTPYCLASHTAICTQAGLVRRCSSKRSRTRRSSDAFSEAEQVAIHLAEVMTLDAAQLLRCRLRAAAQLLLQRGRGGGADGRHRPVQLLQPLQRPAADGAHPAGLGRGAGFGWGGGVVLPRRQWYTPLPISWT